MSTAGERCSFASVRPARYDRHVAVASTVAFIAPELEPLITYLLTRAERTIRPEKVWLFGSRARGTHQSYADVDLAFLPAPESDAHWAEFVAEVEEDAPTLLELDLVNVRTCQTALRKEILRHGRLIYDRAA